MNTQRQRFILSKTIKINILFVGVRAITKYMVPQYIGIYFAINLYMSGDLVGDFPWGYGYSKIHVVELAWSLYWYIIL